MQYNLKKTKRTLLICSAFIFIIMLIGCKKPVPELSEGTYVFSASDSSTSPIEITFDLEDSRFVFTAMPQDADFMTGTIKIDNGKVSAKTDDERFTYVFEIKDNNTISFIEEDSSSLVGVNGIGEEFNLADGSEFVFSGNNES